MTHKSSYLAGYSRKFVRNYNLISSMLIMGKWSRLDFLNLGYIGYQPPFDCSRDKYLIQNENEEVRRNSITLYTKTLEGLGEGANSALEIGSGLGGGCYLLKQYYKVPDVTGVDYTLLNVLYSRKKFRDLGIKFVHGSAETCNSLNRRYDVILSLEASQLFNSWEKFMANVSQLLSDQGKFFYADIFTPGDRDIIEKIITDSGLQITYREDITPGVIESVKRISGQHEDTPFFKFIKKLLRLENLGKFDAYHEKAEMHQKIINGELCYMKYIITKRP